MMIPLSMHLSKGFLGNVDGTYRNVRIWLVGCLHVSLFLQGSKRARLLPNFPE